MRVRCRRRHIDTSFHKAHAQWVSSEILTIEAAFYSQHIDIRGGRRDGLLDTSLYQIRCSETVFTDEQTGMKTNTGDCSRPKKCLKSCLRNLFANR
ncbi:hypothetical protein EVAR_99554_1 [Eumeta japonica]|uniref:Uncharacterized protein n=1 Tax=Eumeta variegata TaxID=151549 RepID=A0A4C1YS70_EUMVA|nr:hypothetical protein EVAR_99554_1 [Eumeta japonica]